MSLYPVFQAGRYKWAEFYFGYNLQKEYTGLLLPLNEPNQVCYLRPTAIIITGEALPWEWYNGWVRTTISEWGILKSAFGGYSLQVGNEEYVAPGAEVRYGSFIRWVVPWNTTPPHPGTRNVQITWNIRTLSAVMAVV